MAQICFDTTTFYTVMIAGFSIIVYVIITIYKEKLEEAKNLIQNFSSSESAPSTVIYQSQPEATGQIMQHMSEQDQSRQMEMGAMAASIQRLEDLQRMHHPMAPPMRRGDFSYSGASPNIPVSIPTRGEYGSFQQMGYLYNQNDNDQAMPLMGRRIHSNQYEYYTFHHNNPNIKIPIKIQGNKEVMDGENVAVDGYTNLQAKIYQIDSPRYIPY
jgi:hypothetical protein